MSNITKNLNIYKDVTNLIGARSFGKEDLVVPYRQLIATVVGSPKIGSDFVARGFTSGSYIRVPNNTIYTKFEMVIKFKTPITLPSDFQGITGQITNNKTTPQIEYNTDGTVDCLVTTSTSSDWYGADVKFNTSLNTWYWVKYIWNNGVAELLYSTNGIDYTSAGTYTVPSINWSEAMAIGKDTGNSFTGFIDLNECYIKVDDVEIWRGVKITTTISRNDMQNYVLDGIKMQPVVGDSKAVIDFSNVKLPWKFEYKDKMQTSRFAIAPLGTTVTQPRYAPSINATKVGNVQISEDFIASGFSSSNYLKIPSQSFGNANNWEILFKVTTGSNTAADQKVFHACSGTGFAGRYGFGFNIVDNRLAFFVSSNNSSWLFDLTGSYRVLPNTTYYIKASFSGTQYKLSYSLDNVTFIDDIIYDSTSKVYSSLPNAYISVYSTSGFIEYWLGTMDLNECYIKINDEEVWRGGEWVATEEMETLQGCVRYYFGHKPDATTPPEDSSNTYNIYAVNGDEGVVLDSKWYDYGGLTTRPVLGDGPVPAFENEWYLGEYRVDTGEEGSPYSPDSDYFNPLPGGGIVLS